MYRNNKLFWIFLVMLAFVQNSIAAQFLSCRVVGQTLMGGQGGGIEQLEPTTITVEVIKKENLTAILSQTAPIFYKFSAFSSPGDDGEYKNKNLSNSSQYILESKTPEGITIKVNLNRVTGDLSVSQNYEKKKYMIQFTGKCEAVMGNNKF